MSNFRFPTALKPIVSKGYSYARGSNVFRSEVSGGLPRQGRDTYFEPVPFNIALVVSALGNQTFQSFLTKISGGADSFVMALDSGLGVKDHQCMITSSVNIDTSDGINWNLTFTLMAERTDIQEETCLMANLPDLFGCYGDGLNCFLSAYGVAQTTFPRIWSDEGPAGYPPINMQALALDNRVVYTGPQVSYLNSAGLLATSATNEWPLTFVGGVAVGRTPPRDEESNLLRYSTDLTNPVWSLNSNVTLLTNATSLITGAESVRLIPTASSGTHYLGATVAPITVGSAIAAQAIVKPDGMSVLQILWSGGPTGVSGQYANFDLTNQTSAGTAASRIITAIGGGWYLCSCVTTVTGDMSSFPRVIVSAVPSIASGRTPTFTGDGASGLLFANVQQQNNNLSAEPIITNVNPVTRPAATAKVTMSGAVSIDVTYSDGSVVNSPAVGGYADIPQADTAWGSKYITRIDFNV